MGYPLKMSKSNRRKKTGPSPGDYDLVVVSIEDDPGYRPGDAFRITYELSRNGKVYPFRETFVNDLSIERTADFVQYLADNGIPAENIDMFVGRREKVKLLKENLGERGIYLNIVEREMVEA